MAKRNHSFPIKFQQGLKGVKESIERSKGAPSQCVYKSVLILPSSHFFPLLLTPLTLIPSPPPEAFVFQSLFFYTHLPVTH